MSQPVIRGSFTGGEFSPELYGRTDFAKYNTGVQVLRNFFVDYRGGASSRQGTAYCLLCLKPNKPVRLFRFQFSDTQAFAMEFGDHYIRFYSKGGAVLEAPFDITAISYDSGAFALKITAPGHNFVENDWVYINGVQAPTQINGNTYTVDSVSGDDFFIYTIFGGGNTGPYPSYDPSGGTIARVYTLTSPWAAEDLALLKYDESADVLTFTHPNYAPYYLKRFSNINWTLTPVVFGSAMPQVTGLVSAATPSVHAPAVSYAYVVTAVDVNGDEGAPATPTSATTDYMALYQATIDLSWTAVPLTDHYNVYRTVPAVVPIAPALGANYGFVGTTVSTSFVDTNITPSFATTPPTAQNPFAAGNNPGVSCYFQQRHLFAASTAFPTTIWGSKVGNYNNFDHALPVVANDSFTFSLVSLQVNPIKWMIPVQSGLIVLTGSGAWQMSGGGQNTAMTPINAIAQPQAYNGCSDVQPLIVNYDILYCSYKGGVPRDLSYNFYLNIWTGIDLSVLSNHLFHARNVTEWAYAEEPFKLIWTIMSDGSLLSLSYMKEQELTAWARHDTLGTFASVTTIIEDSEDAPYFITRRQIQGSNVQVVERMHSRNTPNGREDAWRVDCGIEYPMNFPDTTLSPHKGSGGAIVVAGSPGTFNSQMIGDILRVGGGQGLIDGYLGSSTITVTWIIPMTAVAPGTDQPIGPNPDSSFPSGSWSISKPTTVVQGLDPLEGLTVTGVADGNVIPPTVVVNGQITLQHAASRIIVGLPFEAQLQTLRLDVGEPTIQGKRKRFSAVTVRVAESTDVLVGETFDNMWDTRQDFSPQVFGTAAPLFTGDLRVPINGGWNPEGFVCIQQSDPLPVTVLAVIPELSLGDQGKP